MAIALNNDSLNSSDSAWAKDKALYGWELPLKAPWPLRLPVIRRFRAIALAIKIIKHEDFILRMGLGIPDGYDLWVLYAIKRGWC